MHLRYSSHVFLKWKKYIYLMTSLHVHIKLFLNMLNVDPVILLLVFNLIG